MRRLPILITRREVAAGLRITDLDRHRWSQMVGMWTKGVDSGQRKALSTGRARCADGRIVHMSTALSAAPIDFVFGADVRGRPRRAPSWLRTADDTLAGSVSSVEDLPQEP